MKTKSKSNNEAHVYNTAMTIDEAAHMYRKWQPKLTTFSGWLAMNNIRLYEAVLR